MIWLSIIWKIIVGALDFVLPFIFSLSMYSPETSLIINSTYDYIIVGAGTAGSVVASRLSEDPCVKVLLLEDGPPPHALTEVPVFTLAMFHTDHDWAHYTVPQKRAALALKNQQMYLPQGKGVGGTSLLNLMVYSRGNKRDYDSWAKQGATGWAWQDVFGYFLKLENNTDPEIVENGYHGTDGYLTIQSSQFNNSLNTAFAKAGTELGYEYRDCNGDKQTGFHKMQGITRNGRKCTTAKAYLIPAQDRDNLDILDGAFVTKILINSDKEAYGVLFEHGNRMHEVHATKEVIISGGAIKSPQLLMLSGIGPRDHLEELGIQVIADLPVGNNYQDQIVSIFLHAETSTANLPSNSEIATEQVFLKEELLFHPLKAVTIYNQNRTGPLASFSGVEGQAWINSKFNDPSLDWPDLQVFSIDFSPSDVWSIFKNVVGLSEGVYSKVYDPYIARRTFTLPSAILRPKSRGTVRLASKDPKAHPLIDPNFFEVEEDLDRIVEAMKFSVKIVEETNAFMEIGAKMFTTKFPGCEQHTLYSESYLRCMAKLYTFGMSHYWGTCKMGSPADDTTVVDPQLRVKGVKGLRVVDASIMPVGLSGSPFVPVVMIGEKASDMIKADNKDINNC